MLLASTFIATLMASFGMAIPADLEKRITHSGVATYYEQYGQAGSCGQVSSDSSYVIALSNYWQKNQSPGPYCGRNIQITNTGGGSQNYGQGKTITATVRDTCPGCDENHLDLSEGAFKALTGGNLDPPGQFNIDWHFCSTSGSC